MTTQRPTPPTERLGDVSERAWRLHHEALLFDAHNDLPWQLRQKAGLSWGALDIAEAQPSVHTDIPRMRAGGVKAQFWAVYVPADVCGGDAIVYALEQFDALHRMHARYGDELEFATSARDVERITATGRIASLIGVEGGHAIGNSLAALRAYHRLGARYLTLTHNDTIEWADSATDEPRHGGLTPFGEDVVRTLNELGMLPDISHVSPDTMRHVLRVSRRPVVATHSNAFAIAPHPRNVPDDVLEGIARSGGVCCVNFCGAFLHPQGAARWHELYELDRRLRAESADEQAYDAAIQAYEAEHPTPRGDVETLVDHIDHIARVAGIDHVGIGSDFDGIKTVPVGLDDVSCYPRITHALLERGYADGDIRKILGDNLLRVLHDSAG
ncbi:MAG: membrane dipeptidase [Planctomycetota bacterium]|nr:MAG: membrane dipeptidase [Planctomycetota bacterium]